MKILCRNRENLVGGVISKECKVNQKFIWVSRTYNQSTLSLVPCISSQSSAYNKTTLDVFLLIWCPPV
jgi:hypothetical protein